MQRTQIHFNSKTQGRELFFFWVVRILNESDHISPMKQPSILTQDKKKKSYNYENLMYFDSKV